MEFDLLEMAEVIGKFFIEHKGLIGSIFANIIFIYATIKALDILQTNLTKKLKVHKSEGLLLRLLPQFIRVLKFLLSFLIIASFLQSNGYSVTSLIAGFGIAGMAVGFAAKETIANIFGSFAVISDNVYKVGDYIQFNGMEGTVQEINFRSTKIVTMNNFIINIPNNIMANTAVLNMTPIECRRIDMFVGIEYSTPNEKIEKAVEILKEVSIAHSKVENNPLAFVHELDASQITLRLYVNTVTPKWAEYVEIKSEVIREIVRRYREEGISFAFPSQSLYVQNINEN